MHFLGLRDRLPLFGLAVALMVIFQRPIRSLLEVIHELEVVNGLTLLPGLIILVVALLFHYQSNRERQRVEGAATAARAEFNRERTLELARIVNFGQAIAKLRDIEGLREALRQHLPQFVGNRQAWALLRNGGKWQSLIGKDWTSHRPSPALEALSDQVLELDTNGHSASEGSEREGYVCFPLIVGEASVGVVGVAAEPDPADSGWRRGTATAVALLAIAVRNIQLIQELHEHGAYDGLTGCFNRMHAMTVLDSEMQRASRAKSPLSAIMLDLDHFKGINDRYGHLCGDEMLTAIGQRMKETLRNSDVKCRYGGEEFLVLLPDTPLAGAVHVAESLRREIGLISVQWDAESVSTTASFGVALSLQGELDSRALISRADTALYQAKREGRNRVCLGTEQLATPVRAKAAHGPQRLAHSVFPKALAD